MQIGFLACPGTLPTGDTSERRGDAFEHDLQVAAIRPAIEATGGSLAEINWRAPVEDFTAFDCVLIGTAWDYQDHPQEFLAKLDALESQETKVFNSAAQVRWNIDKHYLIDLETKGARIIPTLWPDNPNRTEVEAALDHFACDKVVVKRQTGGGAEGQHIFARDALPDAGWQMGHKAMIQPFLPSIQSEGELSLLFIDGAYSHAALKTAADGDYRIQSLYGGQEQVANPSEADIAVGYAVIDAIPYETPLYARIDLVRDNDGALAVMEAEIIEPFLYPVQGPELGERMAKAIAARLS